MFAPDSGKVIGNYDLAWVVTSALLPNAPVLGHENHQPQALLPEGLKSGWVDYGRQCRPVAMCKSRKRRL